MNERISLFNKALENNLRHKAKLQGEDGGKLMYDELVKRLREEASSWCINCCYRAGDCICAAPDDREKDCDICSKLQAADAIEELQRICNAMKPKHDAVCVKCAYYAEAKYNDKGFLICPASGMDITAWDFCSYFEPLPEPPKEETP